MSSLGRIMVVEDDPNDRELERFKMIPAVVINEPPLGSIKRSS